MDKEITKNRRALIRYFYTVKNSKGGPPHECECAKHNILLCLGLKKEITDFMNVKDYEDYKDDLAEMLDLDGTTWDRIEYFYEGWTKERSVPFAGLDGKPKSMRETAEFLQTLPGWPTVL